MREACVNWLFKRIHRLQCAVDDDEWCHHHCPQLSLSKIKAGTDRLVQVISSGQPLLITFQRDRTMYKSTQRVARRIPPSVTTTTTTITARANLFLFKHTHTHKRDDELARKKKTILIGLYLPAWGSSFSALIIQSARRISFLDTFFLLGREENNFSRFHREEEEEEVSVSICTTHTFHSFVMKSRRREKKKKKKKRSRRDLTFQVEKGKKRAKKNGE